MHIIDIPPASDTKYSPEAQDILRTKQCHNKSTFGKGGLFYIHLIKYMFLLFRLLQHPPTKPKKTVYKYKQLSDHLYQT